MNFKELVRVTLAIGAMSLAVVAVVLMLHVTLT